MENKRKNENESKPSKKQKTELPLFDKATVKLESLSDLITIGKNWNKYKKELTTFKDSVAKSKKMTLEYNNILHTFNDYDKIGNIVGHLEKLNNLIGLAELKKSIVNQILFFSQGLNNKEMMHTVLYGSPGVGKTLCSEILGNIYKDLGILKKGTFKIAQRSDFIGEYLGSTAIKTKKLLESCIGGVLLIDEAYSLGSKEKRDSFAKEAIDTLNQFLSEHTENFICIIAGYEENLKECFFSWNAGLERRFPWKFNMCKYSTEELTDILKYQIEKDEWQYNIPDEILLGIIKKNETLFKHNGGDCLLYFDKCKISHAKRVFGLDSSLKFVLSEDDFVQGMKTFKINKQEKSKETNYLNLYI